MSADELIAELNASFQHELYPGDSDIVTNNAPDYDLESLQIRDAFKVHTWQTLPDELMQQEQGAYIFLSKKGLRYYLPAYLRFAVRAYAEADSIPDGLIFTLTLPAEVDEMISAFNMKRYRLDERMPAIDWNEYYQTRLQKMNEKVHRFIDRYSQFSLAQSRAIYHFLTHMRDEHGEDYWESEPATAIERYWFQFA
ncbi:DUF6714 family protein [Hymenobacter terrenus]|uniref:DUF6714 family protein n=1 Tax=Hymenobacter terrenus TaxID=1629124 RepID=UPI0006198BB6|nr:DUF6714 family protein [Hymenobacter terrenus]